MNWNRVAPDLYLGSCPASLNDVLTLTELGVGVVVNLQQDEDMESHSLPWEELSPIYLEHGFEALRVPMDDHQPTSVRRHLTEAVDLLHRYLDEGWAVYLHCTSGVNRAPTVAIGYLAKHGGLSLDEATSHVMTRRACMPFVEIVEEWLEEGDEAWQEERDEA